MPYDKESACKTSVIAGSLCSDRRLACPLK
jgi:hypothetical protein